MRLNRTIVGVLAAGMLLGSPALAQPVGRQMPRVRTPDDPPPTLISVDFNGGTLAQFVTAIKSQSKEPVNILPQGDAAKIPVEAVQLRDVDVETALRAALETKLINQETMPDGMQRKLYLETIRGDAPSKPAFVVGFQTGGARATVPQAPGMSPGNDSVTAVYSIQRLVHNDDKDGMTTLPETVVLSAIDTGLKLASVEGVEKPELQYHKDSGLLLVRGRRDDVSVVEEVLRKLVSDQDRRTEGTRRRKIAEIRQKAETQRAQISVELAEIRCRTAEQHLQAVQKQADGGAVSRDELIQAQAMMDQTHAELAMTRIELDRLTREAEAGVEDPQPTQAFSPQGDNRTLQMQLQAAKDEIEELKKMVKAIQPSGAKPASK